MTVWTLAMVIGFTHAWAGPPSCDVADPPPSRAIVTALSAPFMFFGAKARRDAAHAPCVRTDVAVRGPQGRGHAGVRATRATRLLDFTGQSPVWLAADRGALAAPQVEGVLLVESFDQRGRLREAWFVGSDDLDVRLGKQDVAHLPTTTDGPIDLKAQIQADAPRSVRVTALTYQADASNTAVFLVPQAAHVEALELRELAVGRAADQQRDAAVPAPSADRASVNAFEEHAWTSTAPTWANRIVRIGDVDNFGEGFPKGYNPFAGTSLGAHGHPFFPEESDPAGTDRIMIGSGYDGHTPGGRDTYLRQVGERVSRSEPLVFEFLAPTDLEAVLLQIYVDDLQPRRWRGRMQVRLDGRRMPPIERVLNEMDQSGPTGRLLSFAILEEYFHMFDDGRLEVWIDDPSTGAGDAFAVDFAQLAFDPTDQPYGGSISGKIVNEETGRPIPHALVSSGFVETTTDYAGNYVLSGVPAGRVVIQVTAHDLPLTTIQLDITAGEERAAPPVEMPIAQEGDVASALARDGEAQLVGLRFEAGSAALQKESTTLLAEVANTLLERPELQVVVHGHTDDVGGAEANRRLSQERAESVVAWLAEAGVATARLKAVGHGETVPVRSNDTPEGRAANRRVGLSVRDGSAY